MGLCFALLPIASFHSFCLTLISRGVSSRLTQEAFSYFEQDFGTGCDRYLVSHVALAVLIILSMDNRRPILIYRSSRRLITGDASASGFVTGLFHRAALRH
jgi:hypothetical protein